MDHFLLKRAQELRSSTKTRPSPEGSFICAKWCSKAGKPGHTATEMLITQIVAEPKLKQEAKILSLPVYNMNIVRTKIWHKIVKNNSVKLGTD